MNNLPENTISQKNRDTSLDFVKGFLVEIMVIYHIINYYFDIRPQVLLYINFVTGSFVFITGYLISSIYRKKYERDLYKKFFRIFSRGGKLLLLFLLINVSIYSIAIKNYNGYEFKTNQFVSNLGSILLAGSAKFAAFELLVPIAYTLLISSLLVLIQRRLLIILPIVAILLFVSIFGNQDNFFNLFYISIGLSGVAVGFFATSIQHLSYSKWVRYLSVIPVIIYYASIHFWLRDNVLFYFFGIVSVLFCVYSFASLLTPNNFVTYIFTIFGKYTLICYLSQILFLQILYRSMGKSLSTTLSLCVAFIVTNIFLYVFCLLIKRLCSTNRYFDKAYLLFFG
jgi:hypothetical protein